MSDMFIKLQRILPHKKTANYYTKILQKTKNREYGSNVVDQIDNGTVDSLWTTVLVVFDDDAGDSIGIARL